MVRPRASGPWQFAQATTEPIMPVTPERGIRWPVASGPDANMILPKEMSGMIVVELLADGELVVLEGAVVVEGPAVEGAPVVEEPAVVGAPIVEEAPGDTEDWQATSSSPPRSTATIPAAIRAGILVCPSYDSSVGSGANCGNRPLDETNSGSSLSPFPQAGVYKRTFRCL